MRTLPVGLLLLVAGLAPASAQAVPTPGQTAARAAAHRSPVSAAPAREALDAHLDDILHRPDYREAMRAGGHDPQAALRWLMLQFRRLMQRLGGLHETNYGLFLFAVVAGSAVLVALLAHISYTVVHFLRHRPSREPVPAAGHPGRPPTSEELVREAERQAAAGDYRRAIRTLYLALVRHLQLLGVLPRTSSQTNWEQWAHLAPLPRLAAIVRPFTQAFDEIWYGGRLGRSDDFARCRAWLEAALAEVKAS